MRNNETECLLCGGKASLKHNEYPGYQKPHTYKIYHCSECNTAFSLPTKDSSVIYENIYKNGDRVPGYSRYWRYARIIKKVSKPLDYLAESHEDYWSVREALAMYVNDKTSAKILEIGSGLGYLTYALIEAGYNVTGMDMSQTAVNLAIGNFGDHYICEDLFEFSKLAPESIDIVILTEVAEHISNPLEFIKSIVKILKPGGRIIITTPNKSFYPREVIWASDLPPVHCWWLSEDSMIYIAKKLEVNISFINFRDYYKMNYQIIGTLSLLENRLPEPFFNSEGVLIKKTWSESRFKTYIQLILIKLPILHRLTGTLRKYLKKVYGKSRELFSSNVIVCKDRGHILCSVMLKPSFK
jgi:SAM-dependent methyltransferase